MASNPKLLLSRFLDDNVHRHIGYLSEPIYRYRALFSENYLAKVERLSRSAVLWKREDDAAFEGLPRGVAVPDAIPRWRGSAIEGAPGVTGHLLGKWRYSLDDSLGALEDDATSAPQGERPRSREAGP